MHCANYLIINFSWHFDTIINKWINPTSGVDPGFQVRGEGACLIKLRRAEGGTKFFGVFRVKNHDFTPKNHIFSNCGGRREIVWGISCEKSRIYAKKSYFFQLWREARNCLGYFVWKITNLRQKIIFVPIVEGGAKLFGVFRVKNHDFTPKNHIFSNFSAPPPWIRPCFLFQIIKCGERWRTHLIKHLLK